MSNLSDYAPTKNKKSQEIIQPRQNLDKLHGKRIRPATNPKRAVLEIARQNIQTVRETF